MEDEDSQGDGGSSVDGDGGGGGGTKERRRSSLAVRAVMRTVLRTATCQRASLFVTHRLNYRLHVSIRPILWAMVCSCAAACEKPGTFLHQHLHRACQIKQTCAFPSVRFFFSLWRVQPVTTVAAGRAEDDGEKGEP